MSDELRHLRPLTGLTVGISIAESEESGQRGYDAAEVNRCVVRLAEALLGQGARLVFGHDWRPDGVMESIALLAQQYAPVTPGGERPRIVNYVPWPDEPALARQPEFWNRLRSIVDVRKAGLPEPLRHLEGVATVSPVLRAAGLSYLRQQLNNDCDARVCLGGRTRKYGGWFPGIVEEAWLAVQSGKPLYVSAMLGGASAQVIKALRQPNDPAAVFPPEAELLQLAERLDELRGVLSVPPPLRFHATAPTDNGLRTNTQEELFSAREIDDVIVFVLGGLLKVAARHGTND